ncbi:MAG: LptE family protein [Lentisphaerae bacterium]|nr:LptE family protein [Lentisphaerota bacterium]
MKKTVFASVTTLIMVIVVGGCVGYRLGSSLPRDIKTIYIPTFTNKSGEPLVEMRATSATIAEFQNDGTLKIATADTADVTLEATITRLELEPLSYTKADKRKPNEYRMTLTASYILTRTGSREVIAQEKGIKGEATFVFAGNLTAAKLSAMPNATEDLAKRIVEAVVEYW